MIEFFITFIKTSLFNLSSSFVYIKSKKIENIKKKTKLLILIVNIIFSTIYAGLYNEFYTVRVNAIFTNILNYFTYLFVISMLFRIRFIKAIGLSFISVCLSFFAMIISIGINFIIIKIISTNIVPINMSNSSIIEYISVGIVQFLLLFLFFKINRYKDGFSFIKSDKNSNILGIAISIIILLICIIYCSFNNNEIGTFLVIGIMLGGMLMINWLRTSITKYYKERMKDRTVELQSKQLKEKDEIISNLNQELSNVLEINHKYNKRLSAMEKAIGNFGNKLSFNEEFAKEYSDILDSLKDLSKEYKQEFENYNILPKTNIFTIDNLLDYMKTEAIRNNIEFELEINENINELIEKHISKNKLETLLGDHITDAIIAINASDNSYKKIKVIIGKEQEFYKISVFDTGIEFEIETLLKLGLERITTHKDSGGTGIGFMTTFETLKECKASLIIEEYNNEKDYIKSVNVIFDGKSEYNIKSYRAEKINYQTRTIE